MFALCRKANRRLRLAALQTCGIALVLQRTFWTAIGSMILGGGTDTILCLPNNFEGRFKFNQSNSASVHEKVL